MMGLNLDDYLFPRCEFCRDYTIRRQIDDFKTEHPEYYENQKSYFEYTVVFVTRTWRKNGSKRAANTEERYRRGKLGYKLNFCPECGRKLNI